MLIMVGLGDELFTLEDTLEYRSHFATDGVKVVGFQGGSCFGNNRIYV